MQQRISWFDHSGMTAEEIIDNLVEIARSSAWYLLNEQSQFDLNHMHATNLGIFEIGYRHGDKGWAGPGHLI